MVQKKRRGLCCLALFSFNVVVVALILVCVCPGLQAQAMDPLALEWAEQRIELERNQFLVSTQQITPEENKQRYYQIVVAGKATRAQIARRPRPQQAQIAQQQESLFQVRIVPLREQWKQQQIEFQQQVKARDARRQIELKADADKAGKFQAARTFLAEKSQRQEISQSEFQRLDHQAEQEVLNLQNKYTAYGPNWGSLFSRTMAQAAQKTVAETRLKDQQSKAQQARDQQVREQQAKAHVPTPTPLPESTTPPPQTDPQQPSPPADTGNAANLAELPSADRVARDVRTNSARETAARASVALGQLANIVRAFSGGRAAKNQLLPAEAAKIAEYEQKSKALLAAEDAKVDQNCNTDDCDKYRVYRCQQFYMFEPASYRELLDRYFSPQWQSQYAGKLGGTIWRDALSLPVGTKAVLSASAVANCSDGAIVRTKRFPLPRPRSNDTSYAPLALLALLAAAGGGYFFYRKRSQAPVQVAYSDLKAVLPPASEGVFEAASKPARSSTPSLTLAKGAGLKERLFAEQKQKYQVRYNDAQDEVTNAGIELSQLKAIPAGVQGNLHLLSKTLPSRMRALIEERHGSLGKIALNAAILKPAFRLFMRAGWLVKLGLLIAVGFFGKSILQGDIVEILLIYGVLFVVFFFMERRQQLKVPLAAVKHSSEQMKDLSLGYIYEEQTPHSGAQGPMLHAIRINATAKGDPTEEFVLPAGDPSQSLGRFLLRVGTMAMYRFEPNGTATLAYSNSENELMNQHGKLLTEAVNEQKTFVENTLPPLAEYGRVAWQRRQASNQLPHLKKLVDDVDRMEKIWRDAWVGDKVFEFLLRRIDLFNIRDSATPPGLLLYGYPGNGKAYLAEKIAKSISARLEGVNPAGLTAASVGLLWEKLRGKEPVVLFLDYAERALSTRDAGLAWLTEWAKQEPRQSRVWVVLTAQSEKDLDPSILKHIGGSKIEVGPPTEAGRELILRKACRQHDLQGALPVWLVGSTGGSSVQELLAIVQETKLQCIPDPPEEAHWRQAIKNVRGADAEFQNEKKTWDRLILPADIKEQLVGACTLLKNVERFKKIGADVPNIVLYGPPGTGKTEVARTIASEAGVKFVAADLADLKGSKVGQSAPLVRAVFAKARAAAPAVLFIDEIENLTPKRTGDDVDSFTKDIIQQMLTEMDGAKQQDRPVFVLAATNHVQMIDSAILRRFSTQISIPLPDDAGRRAILKGLILDRPVDPKLDVDDVCAQLSKRLDGKSGSDLRDLVKRAIQNAVTAAVASNASPDDVKLTREILLAEVMPKGRAVSEEQLQRVWSQIVLKSEVKDSILGMIRLFNNADPAAPTGLLLYGPPGTGKTEIARCIAKSSSSHFMDLKGSSLRSQYSGQAGHFVKKQWEEARSHPRCVMFIDECEGVFTRRGGTHTDKETEDLVREFLAQWDGMGSAGQVWVIGATNQHDRLDQAIVSRFGPAVEIGLPGANERRQILQLEMKKLDHDEEIPEFTGTTTTGFAGRDLSKVAKGVYTLAAQRKSAVTPEIWKEVIGGHRKASSAKVDEGARWDTLVLAEDTLKRLQDACDTIRDIEVVQKQGIEAPRGGLLFGPPGTGKTQIAKTMANESGLAFIEAKTSDIKAGHVGQSALKLRELFDRARDSAPSILFIDEIDRVAAVRGGSNSDSFTEDIVNEMLAQMEGVSNTGRHVFVLGATNHPEHIDSGILSRFAFKIEIPNPDTAQRRRLFQIFLAKKPNLDFNADSVATELAERSKGMSGRDIRNLVEAGAQLAYRRAIETGTKDRIILKREDLLAQLGPQGKEVSEIDIEKAWAQIVLKPEVKESIMTKIRMFTANDPAAPRGLLLYGPSGTGKTEIARRIAESAGSHFMSLTGSSLKSAYSGQSGEFVKKTWEEARSYGRCVMFVDECEGVFASRGGLSSDKSTDDLVREFLAMWDGMDSRGQVWVVGATNHRDQIDNAIISRFGATVEIGLPGPDERLQILRLEMKKFGRGDVEIPDFVARDTNGFSGRELSMLGKDVCTMAAERKSAITADMWRDVVTRHRKASSDGADETARWETLVLDDATTRQLQTMCKSLKNIEFLKAQGRSIPRGALLYGPPGTGKTQIARTLANESGLTVLLKGPTDIKAGFLGQSGQKVKELFAQARDNAPCILFIDEFDSGAAARGSSWADQYTDEIVPTLLAELDGAKKSDRHVFLLAATNHQDRIDPALRERFTYEIEIPKPNLAQRQRLFKIFLGNQTVDFDIDHLAAELAETVGDVGGREIQNRVKRAEQRAIERAFAGDTPGPIVVSREDLMS